MAVSGASSQELSQHSIDLRSFGDAVAMATVVATYEIFLSEIRTRSCRDCFLSNVTVSRSLDRPFLEELRGRLFEASNPKHDLKQPQQRFV